MEKAELSWLHLSDFHFGKGESWKRDRVLSSLVRDVLEPLQREQRLPRWVCVTGDIANTGKKEQYEDAKAEFAKLAAALGHHPKTDWFLVPGNHDVFRDEIKPKVKRERAKLTYEDIEEVLTDSELCEAYTRRQANFFQFTAEFLGSSRAFTPEKPWQVESRQVGDLRVAFLCLNSAWLCQDDHDARWIAIGEYQAHQAVEEANQLGADLKIALFHHPFEDLREDDRKKVKNVLTAPGGCQVLLRGHLHESDLEFSWSPDSCWFPMASGACWYDAEHAHSVNWVRLDLAAETVEIRIWSYSSERNGFWKPATELYRNFNGTVTKPIPASWHLSPLESPTGGEETGDGVAGPKPATFAVPIAYKDLMLGQYSDLDAYFSKDKAGKLNLEQVFVSLETGWREPDKNRERRLAGKRGADSQADEAEEPEKPQPQPCENLCRHPTYRHFVLAGKPGSGKSTLLRYLVVSRLHREPDLLPLHLPLRDMQAWLNRKKGHAGSHILDWAADTYGSHGIDRVFLERHTGQGKILWLLDGLDEIFDLSLRLRAAKIIGNWFTSNQGRGDRLILTTRPHALEQARILGNLALPDTRASILPLSEPLQEAFLSHWFLGLYGPTRKKTADEKKQALWHLLEGRPDPDPFRDNPLMLSVLAIIFYNGKTLPERRADLYEQAVDMLLTQRFGPNEKDGSIEKVEQIMRGLGLVARRLLERGRASDVGCHDFQTWFTEGYGRGKHGDQEDVTPLIRELGNHSGLLTQSGDGQPRYAFAHLTFQEYLAARSYAKDREPSKLLRERLGVGTWREVVLLTAGCLFALGADFRGQDFIRGIFACCGDGDTSAVGLSLAMEAMAEAPNHIDLHEDIQKSKALTLAILGNRDSQVPEAARDALGLALGKLGDPRLGVVKPERWVWIPLGRFTMGRNDGDKDEQPEHEVEVDRGFFLGKYPVTNEEYRAFVEADGYGDARWWSRLGRSWLEKEAEGVKTPELWEDRAFNGANQPVVGVSWFEAEAYCNWLGAVLEKNRPGGWAGTPRVYMPSEIQWEYAARGSAGRRHPWGEQEPDEMVANYEGRLGRTSAVGIYPRGATPEGLLDMAGNVWEWCRTRYEGKAYALSTQERESLIIEEIDQSACLRGGSWSYGARGLPAACRLWFWAGGRFDLVGFRCCCVAGPSAEP